MKELVLPAGVSRYSVSKGEKIRIIKHKAKKGYRKRQGHRQPFTQLSVEKINA